MMSYFSLAIAGVLVSPLAHSDVAEILEPPGLVDGMWEKGLAVEGKQRSKEIPHDYIALAAVCNPVNGLSVCLHTARMPDGITFIHFHQDILPAGSYVMLFSNDKPPQKIESNGAIISFDKVPEGEIAFVIYIPKKHFPGAKVFSEQHYTIADGSSRIEVDPGMEVSTSISIKEGTNERNLKKIIQKFSMDVPLIDDIVNVSNQLENITEHEVTVTKEKTVTETFKHRNDSRNKRWIGYYHVQNKIYTSVENQAALDNFIKDLGYKWYSVKKEDLTASLSFELIAIDPYSQPTRKAICIQQKETGNNEYVDCHI
ncbi:MAG: hypothetical protein GKR77_00520 [Legionellales bacterium]|nr:hypothetical protein [Legionellales bacterium]